MHDFDLEQFLPYRLYQAAEHAASQGFRATYSDRYGINRTEWRVLFNVGQYAPISAAQISRRSGIHKTRISRAVLKLEQKQWLHRLMSPQNRRQHELELTDMGEDIFTELSELASSYNNRLVAILDQYNLSEMMECLLKIEQC